MLIKEFLPGGNLREKMKQGLTTYQKIEILYQIAYGLAAAHNKSVVHLDLKPESILFNENGVPKIIDWGNAAKEGETPPTLREGTGLYTAPEQYFNPPPASRKMDVHAWGAIAIELLAECSPDRLKDIVAAIWNGYEENLLDGLLRRCLSKDLNDRPDMETVLEELEEIRDLLAQIP